MLIINNDLAEINLNSLINLIMNNESCHLETIKLVYSHFKGNWS